MKKKKILTERQPPIRGLSSASIINHSSSITCDELKLEIWIKEFQQVHVTVPYPIN